MRTLPTGLATPAVTARPGTRLAKPAPPSSLPRWLAVIALVAPAACGRIESAESGGGAAMMRHLLRAEAVEIVVRPGPLEDACWKVAERIARERRVGCRVVAPAQRGDPRAVRIVVAGPESELAISILDRMGLAPDAGEGGPSFSWRQATFADSSDAVLAVLEDPDRPGLPLTLLYGNEETELEPFLAAGEGLGGLEPGWKPSFRIYRKLEPTIEAALSFDGWIDESRLTSRAMLRIQATRGYEKISDPNDPSAVWAAPRLSREAVDRYLESVSRARALARSWAGEEGESAPVRLYLHDRPEALDACVGGAALSDWNPRTRTIHALLAPDVPDDGGLTAARIVAEDLLGPPSAAWMADGAAAFAARRHYGRDLDEWIAWLHAGGAAPGVGALVRPQATEAMSPHLVLPLRAALFRFLLEGRGEAFVRSLWTGESKLLVDPELELSFDRWLDESAAPRRSEIDARHAARRGDLLSAPFLAAVGMAEPGSEPDRGFGSRAFEESLSQARELGAGAAALTCFVVAERDPMGLPDIGPGARGRRALAATCGDLRLFAALCQARAKGMRTLLQPRLLTAPGGPLAGTGPQNGEKGWQRFFDAYSRIFMHFALLGELAGAEGLSLGGGMTASTSGKTGEWGPTLEAIGWRREGWGRVVREARGAFSGSLTWAADSLLEAQELMFWDDLDLVSCDLEPELDVLATSFRVQPAIQLEVEIDSSLALLEELARSHSLPLLLTQAGFRSGMPAPGAERAGRIAGIDELQAMQLNVLGQSIQKARQRSTLRGAVLWRWSTDPSDRGANTCDALLRPGPARDAAAAILRGR
ncbi:MAG: glycoside hydrolase family 113 [Planctomycetota bacterium]